MFCHCRLSAGKIKQLLSLSFMRNNARGRLSSRSLEVSLASPNPSLQAASQEAWRQAALTRQLLCPAGNAESSILARFNIWCRWRTYRVPRHRVEASEHTILHEGICDLQIPCMHVFKVCSPSNLDSCFLSAAIRMCKSAFQQSLQSGTLVCLLE